MWKTKHLMGIEWGYNGAIYTMYIYIYIHIYTHIEEEHRTYDYFGRPEHVTWPLK